MPPYHKPLLVVSGEPIVLGAAKRAWIAGSPNIIVVVAPENALPIAQVMEHGPADMRYQLVVQPRPTGPGDALLTGLNLVKTEEVLVLLGDNVTNFRDIKTLLSGKGNCIGIQQMRPNLATRFTRQRQDGSWVEKVPITEADKDAHGECLVWVGPFKVDVAEIKQSLLSWQATQPLTSTYELLIGPCFNDLSDVHTCAVDSIDIGTPEGLPR
jgi:hypothetical protein